MSYLKTPLPLSYDGLVSNVAEPRQGIFITLPDVSELESLPACGEITFRYTRESLRLPKDNKLSAEICLCELLEVEGDEEAGAEEKTDNVVDKLFDEAKKTPEDEEKE